MALHSSLFTATLSNIAQKPHVCHRPHLNFVCTKRSSHYLFLARSSDNVAGSDTSSDVTAIVEDKKVEERKEGSAVSSQVAVENKKVEEEKNGMALGSNGTATRQAEVSVPPSFNDLRWVGGTWDLMQFRKDGKTDWDAVIDSEVRRRKWLEDNPEASSNDEPVIFDTSVIPWWSWVKRFHLPEAEILNGRAAMIGFFMAYFVDSLTGVGLVDQMGNFFCKSLLLIAVLGVLLIRKNEDVENLKKLFDETTFYDKQWQATWQEDNAPSDSNK